MDPQKASKLYFASKMGFTMVYLGLVGWRGLLFCQIWERLTDQPLKRVNLPIIYGWLSKVAPVHWVQRAKYTYA